jgi:ubiquitin carboxyl-terminal hydrolase 8
MASKKKNDIEKHKHKGYTGLINLGNTCFLNACIQVLNHTYELVDFINSSKIVKNIKQDLPDSIITNEWRDLRNIMWTNNGTVSPNKFVFNVQMLAKKKDRDLFTGWAQNDMPEFLLFIIECIHNSISRSINMKIQGNVENQVDELAVQCYNMLKTTYSKEYSEIMEMFYGIYVSEIHSMDGTVRHAAKPESFFILDLPIPEQLPECSIYHCFDLFTKDEFLKGENAWFNEKTNQKEDIKKRITFWSLPNILVITLKRFSYDGERKLNNKVVFSMDELDLSKYINGYNARTYIYELYGVCNHFGGVMGGHYTSFVKNATNEWIHYDDSNVEIVANPENIISPFAYCLFYRKKNNPL